MKRNQRGYGKNCQLKMQKKPAVFGWSHDHDLAPIWFVCRLHKITAPDICHFAISTHSSQHFKNFIQIQSKSAMKKIYKGGRRFHAFNIFAGDQKAILTGIDRTRTAFTYFQRFSNRPSAGGGRGACPSPKCGKD